MKLHPNSQHRFIYFMSFFPYDRTVKHGGIDVLFRQPVWSRFLLLNRLCYGLDFVIKSQHKSRKRQPWTVFFLSSFSLNRVKTKPAAKRTKCSLDQNLCCRLHNLDYSSHVTTYCPHFTTKGQFTLRPGKIVWNLLWFWRSFVESNPDDITVMSLWSVWLNWWHRGWNTFKKPFYKGPKETIYVWTSMFGAWFTNLRISQHLLIQLRPLLWYQITVGVTLQPVLTPNYIYIL